MRIATAFLTILLGACATSGDPRPREFLDEQTAATLTMSSEPVVFVAATATPRALASDSGFDRGMSRDYVEIYGLDVNRMGSHKQYVMLQRWLASDTETNVALELVTGAETIELRATTEDPRKLGISTPPAPLASKSSRWWYFPTDTATLRKLGAASDLRATVIVDDRRLAYELFSDGRAQLGELASALAPR